MTVFYGVIAIVIIQRLAELIYAERNTRRLRERGACEIAAWQHPMFIALHTLWLLSLLIFVPASTLPNWWLLALFFVLQGARLWILTTLGPYWTTRIMTLPGAPLVRTGPYRFVKHPNYAVVILEIAILPLAFGAWTVALVFSLLNALLIALRISAENAALQARS